MQSFDNIKDLWQQGAEGKDLPSAKEILSGIQQLRKKMQRRNLLAIISLIFTFGFIGWIGLYYEFELLTTNAGIILTLLAIITGILFSTKLVNLLGRQNDPTLSNHQYLEQLIAFRNSQRLIQTKGISLYFLLLTAGILLYMLEFARRDLTFGIISYGITIGWILFSWFYLRKRTIRKQEKELNEQIRLLENLISNLESGKD